jgi:hypothetical protein
MTVIEIRPHRWGWKAFEAPGVEPVFPKKDQAIDYAQNRACFRSGQIQMLDSTGNVERVIPFDDTNRKLLNAVIETHEVARSRADRCLRRRLCGFQPKSIS